MRAPTVYLTFDGILGTLGHSQVVRVIEGLGLRGWPYLLVSLERAADLARADRVEGLRERLSRAGVRWFPLTYDRSSSARAAATNLARATWHVARLCLAHRAARVHARGYHSALVAFAVRQTTRVPYLFDARGYWIDERVAEGRWFTRPVVYQLAKAMERRLYAGARAIVTLTELQASDLRAGRLGVACPNVVTIPTCADFDSFRLANGHAGATLAPELRDRLAGRKIIAMVGSLNGSYHVDETYRLCRIAADLSPDAHVLVVSEQRAECEAMLTRHGIARERFTITNAPHEDMPSWLAMIDSAALLLRDSFAKRASMPTKLAEFFAVGVRPLHYGCNSEVADWVQRVGTGLVLRSLADDELLRAARFAIESPRDPSLLSQGRERARAHFSLRTGLDRYERLLASLPPSPAC